MSIIDHPESLRFARATWGMKYADVSFEGTFGSQSQEVDVPRWIVTAEAPPMHERDSGAWQAHLLRLRGRKNQLALWNTARPVPRGTMRGNMTLNSAAAQGAVSVQIIAATESGKTLLNGDLLGIGTAQTQQVVALTGDSVSNSGGVITVTFEPPLRNAFAPGSEVRWNKPKALFRRTDSEVGWSYESILASDFRLNLVEDWR